MRSGGGETLLVLFTSRERAETIVGDLVEQSPTHGSGWYTLEIIRIALALWLRSILSAPGRALALAGLGSLVYGGVYAVLFVASGLPWHAWQRVYELSFLGPLCLVVRRFEFPDGRDSCSPAAAPASAPRAARRVARELAGVAALGGAFLSVVHAWCLARAHPLARLARGTLGRGRCRGHLPVPVSRAVAARRVARRKAKDEDAYNLTTGRARLDQSCATRRSASLRLGKAASVSSSARSTSRALVARPVAESATAQW